MQPHRFGTFAPWLHRMLQYGLIGLIVVYSYLNWPEWIKILEASAWLFVGYMLLRILVVFGQNPPPFVYEVPADLRLPNPITPERLPAWNPSTYTKGEWSTWKLIETLREKVVNAADEASVHALMQERVANLRSSAYQRFAPVSREVNTLAFEGIIGTLLGMMVFMAQASKLFALPETGGDATQFATQLLENLQQVDFIVVLSAFITSVIGWTAKAWIGRVIDARREEELNSLTHIESYLQTQVLARLSLPTRSIVGHTLSMDVWRDLLRGRLRLRVLHVDGGLLLEPEADESSPFSPDWEHR